MKTIKHNPVSLLTTYYGKNQNNFKFNVALSNASVNNVLYPTQYSNEKNYHMSVNFFNFNSIGKFYKDRGKLSPILNRSLVTAVSDQRFYRVRNSSNNVEAQSEKMLINGSTVEFIETSSNSERFSNMNYVASQSYVIHDISNNYIPADKSICSVMTLGTASTDSHWNSNNLFLIVDNAIRQYFVSGHQILDETLGLNLKSYYNTFDNECLNQDELYSKSSILGRSIDLFSNPDEIAPITIPFMNSKALCYNHFAILNPIGWTQAGGIPSGSIALLTTTNNERLRFLPLTYNYETREARILGINYNMYFKNASKFEYKSYDLKFIQYKIDSLSTNPTTDIITTDTQIIQSANEIPYNMNYNVGFSKTLKNGETLFSLLKKDKIVGMNMKRSVMCNKLFFKDLEFITGLTFEMKISRLYSRLEFEINKNINTALISYKDNYLYVGDNKIQFFETVIDEENNPYESEIFPLNDISRESFIIKLVKTNTGFDIFINEYKSTLIVEDIHSLYSNASLVVQDILCLEYVKLYDNNETIDEILTENEISIIEEPPDANVNIKSIVFPATIALNNVANTYQPIYLPPGTHTMYLTWGGGTYTHYICDIYNSNYQSIWSWSYSQFPASTATRTITIHEFGLYYFRISNTAANTSNPRITLASTTYNYNTSYILNKLEYKNMFILADYSSITFPDGLQLQNKKWRYIGNTILNQKIELKIGVSTYTFNCDIDNGRIIPNYSIIDTKFDVYISPQGNDTTGNGTYTKPWKTLKNCRRGQLIGLLPGVYSDAATEYGQVVLDAYVSFHGLFRNAFTTPDYTTPNSGYVMPANLRNGVTGFSGRVGSSILISAVMPGTVTITMRTTSSRDYPFHQGVSGFEYDIVFANIEVQASRGKVHTFSSSYSRSNQFVLFVNMQFNETGYYSLQYNSVSGNPVGYVNCTFTGSRGSNYPGGISIEVSNPALNNKLLLSNSFTLFNHEYLDYNILKVVGDSKLVHSNVIGYLENPGVITTYIKLDNKDIEIPNFGVVECNHTDIIIDRFNQYKYTSNIFTFDDYTKIKFNILDDIELNEIQIINDVEILIPININTEYDISEFMTKQFSLKSSTNKYNYYSEINYSLIKTGTRIVEEIQTDEEGNETIIEHEESYDIIIDHKIDIYHNVYNNEHIKSLNRNSRTFTFTDTDYVFSKYENKLVIKSNNFNLDSMNINDYIVSNNNELKLFSNDTDMHDINTLLYEYDNKKYCVIFNGTCDKHDVYLLEIKKYQDVSYIPDPDATQPEDWVVEYDEEGNEIPWEAPLIPIYNERIEFEFIDSLLNTVRKPLPANETNHSTYLFLYYDSDNLMKIKRLYLTDKIEVFDTNISNTFNQKLIPHAFKFEKYDTMDQLLVNMYKVGDEFRLLVNTNFNDNYGRVNTEDRISYIYNLKKDIFVETEIIQIKNTSIIKDENDQDIEVEVLTNEFILTGIVENIFKEKLINSTITLNIFDDSKSILIKDENDNFINYGKSDIVIHTDSEAKFELNIKIESDISQVKNYFDNAKFIFKIYKFLDAYTFTNNILREI